MRPYVLGIDIGGTKCAVVLAPNRVCKEHTEGFILDRTCFPTETVRGLEHTLGNLFHAIDALLERNHVAPGELAGIGVSCGGPLDNKTGVILNPPNLYGWNEVPIVRLLSERYGAPAFLQNDANACTLAEWKFGAARGFHNVVFLTFGTGMGAGLILDDRLYCGTNDMAGEIGHVRLECNGPVGYGKAGSFEGFCSGFGLSQIARTKVLEALQRGESPSFCPTIAQLDKLDAQLVAEAADAGDPLACEVYQICGRYLGMGLSILIDVLNPEIIVIGSIFQRKRELLWPAALESIRCEALPQSFQACRIEPSALGNSIGDFAALSTVLYQLWEA